MNVLEQFKKNADDQIACLDELLENMKQQRELVEADIIKDLIENGEVRTVCVYCGNDYDEGNWRGCCGEVQSDTEYSNENYAYLEEAGELIEL